MKPIYIYSKVYLFALIALCAISASEAQTDTGGTTLSQWYHKDPAKDNVAGISLEEAYRYLKGKASQKVVVAVLDSGIDTAHIDIKTKLWVNIAEIPGDSIDNDGNGYIDDVYGWNFLGNQKGDVIKGETLEKTRIYRDYHKKFASKSKSEISNEELELYQLYLLAKASYEKEYNETVEYLKRLRMLEQGLERAYRPLINYFNDSLFTIEDVESLKPKSEELKFAKESYLMFTRHGMTPAGIRSGIDHYQSVLDTKLNIDNNPRHIAGDDPSNINDTIYGNNNLDGGTAGHGTSVAGVIAAIRNNDIGIDGIVDNVEIMVLRIVPGGDERDKDVAIAIRYAVNKGAKVINCSFGKEFSPDKQMVNEAVKFAEERGVLIVHAAGNDGQDNDKSSRYPNPYLGNGKIANNWIEVGACTKHIDKRLPANFSNYGKTTVDLFAPGEDIATLKPGNNYGSSNGTSLAAPVVTGVAALLLSYYPALTPEQIKEILLKSVTPYGNRRVIVPGTGKKKRMKQLCVSGGVVNAYKAVKLADESI